jgi:glycosyltransferase involved in cell wall biosynthesis
MGGKWGHGDVVRLTLGDLQDRRELNPSRPSSRSAPLRILHVVSRSQARGAELVAMELADELIRLGFSNRLVALGPGFDGHLEAGLVPLAGFRSEALPQLVMLSWRLRRLLADDRVDVVLAHGGWPAQVAASALSVRGRGHDGRGPPLLVWQRILGFPDKAWGPVRRRWWGAVARRFDAAVALTDELAAELRLLGFGGPVWLIPNFRKPDRFSDVDRLAAGARLRAELGVPSDAPILGFVGHLVSQKRPERVIDVLALLRAQGRRVHLVVAGAGPLRAELEARAGRSGVASAVAFLGHRPDVEWIFGGVDLVLLTSEAEGIPGVAIEALMAGCPMVTVPVGAVAEVVENGVTGLVLEDDHPACMADAVGGLLDNAGARAAMGRNARSRSTRFTASAAAAIYAERLSAALAER